MLIEMEKKETYKSLINPPNDNVSVWWLYPAVMGGKFKKRHSGQTSETPKEKFDST
jgi:hypothetical protein